MNLCPHYKAPFTHVELADVAGRVGMKSLKCISYNCPHCRVSLSVAIDPIAVRTEIVTQVIDGLKHR